MHEPIQISSKADSLQIITLIYVIPVALIGAGIRFKGHLIGVLIAAAVLYTIVGFAYLSSIKDIKFFSRQAKLMNDQNTGDAYLCGISTTRLSFQAASANATGITIWHKTHGTMSAQTTIPYSGTTIEKVTIAMNGQRAQLHDGISIKSESSVTSFFIYSSNCRPWSKPAQGVELDQIIARWQQYAQSA